MPASLRVSLGRMPLCARRRRRLSVTGAPCSVTPGFSRSSWIGIEAPSTPISWGAAAVACTATRRHRSRSTRHPRPCAEDPAPGPSELEQSTAQLARDDPSPLVEIQVRYVTAFIQEISRFSECVGPVAGSVDVNRHALGRARHRDGAAGALTTMLTARQSDWISRGHHPSSPTSLSWFVKNRPEDCPCSR